jgi:shikimate kinase
MLHWHFSDLDAEIEKREQRKIRHIFHDYGEGRFREVEAEALRSILEEAPRPLVLATGGGTFIQTGNAQLLRSRGALVVFLDAPTETLLRRCCEENETGQQGLRPLARDRKSFLRLYAERLPFYRAADMSFESDDKPPLEVAREIAMKLERNWNE